MSATGPATPSSTPSPRWGAAPGGRAVVLWLAMLVSLQVRPWGPPLLVPVLLVAGLVLTVALICGWGPSRLTARAGSPRTVAWFLVATGLLLAGFEEARFAVPGHAAAQTLLPVLFVLLGVGACGVAGSEPVRRAAFVAFVVVAAVMQMAVLSHAPAPGDVGVASHDSIVALLHGQDPYAITLPNPYNAHQTALFYEPENLVDDRLDFGYAYLPVSLLASIPGYLFGNIAYSLVVALVGLTVLLRRVARDDTGRILSLVPLAMPFTPQILINQWVEPIPMLLLGLTAWAWVEGRRRTASVGMGLLLATKQYFVFVLPLLLVVRRGLGRRGVVTALAVAAVTCGAFFVWDPAAFWHSVVWLQFHLPLREDSVTVPVAWSRTFGTAPDWALGPLAVVAGLVVSTLVAKRGDGTSTVFCIGTGLSILASVLFSPHAFSNYYALVEVALVIGCITWPREDRPPSSESAAALVASSGDRRTHP